MNGSAIAIAAAVLFILVMLWQSLKANVRASSERTDIGHGQGSAQHLDSCSDCGIAVVQRRERVSASIDLRQFLHTLQSTGEPTLERHGLRLDLEVPSMPLTVAAHESDLHRAFAHIIRALCAISPPGVTLRILARSDGAQAVINCIDAGGSELRLARAFTAGAPGEQSNAPACRAIVDGLGGRLYAAPSPLGQQSLTLRLPLLRVGTRIVGRP